MSTINQLAYALVQAANRFDAWAAQRPVIDVVGSIAAGVSIFAVAYVALGAVVTR